MGTGFLTGREIIHQMEMFVKLSKACDVDFAQFRSFKEDTTYISAEYERLKSRYEDEHFFALAFRQKYDAFRVGKTKPYDRCFSMFFLPLSQPMQECMLACTIGRILAIWLETCGKEKRLCRFGIPTRNGRCLRKLMCKNVLLFAATKQSIEHFPIWMCRFFIRSFYKKEEESCRYRHEYWLSLAPVECDRGNLYLTEERCWTDLCWKSS